MNTLGKALEFILAKCITYLDKTHYLLFSNILGVQFASSIEYALYYIIEKIYLIWNKKKIRSTLFLDIKSAFDNVLKDWQLHNL